MSEAGGRVRRVRASSAVPMASTISAVNDKFTVEDIALKVSQALSLDATNRELGRSIIREALESADVAAFAERTSSYGSLDREFVETLYEGIVRATLRPIPPLPLTCSPRHHSPPPPPALLRTQHSTQPLALTRPVPTRSAAATT